MRDLATLNLTPRFLSRICNGWSSREREKSKNRSCNTWEPLLRQGDEFLAYIFCERVQEDIYMDIPSKSRQVLNRQGRLNRYQGRLNHTSPEKEPVEVVKGPVEPQSSTAVEHWLNRCIRAGSTAFHQSRHRLNLEEGRLNRPVQPHSTREEAG